MNDYELEDIERILENYKKIESFKFELFNEESADALLDIERALCSELLTPEQSAVLFCLYNLELTLLQSSFILNVELPELNESKKEAARIITDVMNGKSSSFFKMKKRSKPSLLETIEGVKGKEISVFCESNPGIRLEVLEFLRDNNDNLSKNALSYLLTGEIEQGEGIEEEEGEEYPFYADNGATGEDFFSRKDRMNKTYSFDPESLANLSKNKKPARRKYRK